MIKLLPGIAGALCGFAVLKLLAWTGLLTELGVFLVTYVIVSVLVDKAMRRYGRE